MCDYSLHSVKSRPAKVGDKLTTRNFGTGTRGFAASENANVAVCVLPGTELSFVDDVRCLSTGLLVWRDRVINHRTAIFRQIDKEKVATHHDALEFPDGQIVFLTSLSEGQQATVLQLPAEPKSGVEFEAQRRAAYVGWNFQCDGRPNAGGQSCIIRRPKYIRCGQAQYLTSQIIWRESVTAAKRTAAW